MSTTPEPELESDPELIIRIYESDTKKNSKKSDSKNTKSKESKKRSLTERYKLSNNNEPITDLKSLISAFEHPRATIQQKEFVESLRELDSLIGMDKLKDQLINQILFFIQDLHDPNTFLHAVITGPPGTGKCLGYGTKVMMYNGTIKEVQNIKIGDLLMGDDSDSRRVKSICRGIEQMYTVKQLNGDNYVVNESHILSLKLNNYNRSEYVTIQNKKYYNTDTIDISVKDYLLLPDNIKYQLKGYKAEIKFKEVEVPIDPYIIGTLFSNKDHNDIIPSVYKYNSRNNQLKLIAGFVDGCGVYNSKKLHYKLLVNSLVSKDLEYISRCIGLNVKTTRAQQTGYFYLYLFGNNLTMIPCKKRRIKMDKSLNDVHNLCTEISVIRNDEYAHEYYYGFEIDKNRRFLLGDHTVTHNTRAINILAKIYCNLGILKNTDVVKASRSDLIGKWCGHTAIKTKEVLDSAIGSVLIIDEVYSLGSKDRSDAFSKECIDTINQYLSEHVDDFICIIAGYKDLVEDCFFGANPGLERRFPWKFTIDPYTPDELTKIFKLQIEECGWTLDTSIMDEDITKLIKENHSCFNGNGGDTKNLIDKCKIINARKMFSVQSMNKKRKTKKEIISDQKILRCIAMDVFKDGVNTFVDIKGKNKKEPEFMSSMYI